MIAVFVCVPSGHEPAPGVLDAIGQARVIAAGTVWAARQKALDACDSEVLAFVDGDVVVGSGWRERLTSAWAHASQEIAAIGGPIQGSGRAVADLIDLGGRQLDQDPLERTLLGGNLSFRRSALAGVGGFGPTVDERDARDWFAEEHEAQRQLGHWGWLVRYDPALAAQRVDWDGAPRAGRFRYGVRMGIARRRPQALALRTAVMAAAGVAAAVLMRRSGLRRQRTARAAENLGVLLAPLVDSSAFRRRGIAPPQPGRPTAALVRGRSRSRNAAPIILLYHRIADGELDPLGLCVSPRHFEDQLTALTDAGDILGMDELAAEHAAGRLPTGVTCVTFDDGYADNVDALTGLGIPVTLFAATGHIASGDPFFWDEAAALILSPGARPARISISTERGALAAPTRTTAQRRVALQRFHELVQPQRPEAIAHAIEQLRTWAGSSPSDVPRLMTADELGALSQSGVAIGAHTRRHVNLAHQDPEVVRAEIEGSRADVATWTGADPVGFAYPFGLPRHDVSRMARDTVAQAGFSYAVVNQPTAVAGGHDPYTLPRLFAPDLGADAFRAWLG